MELLSVRIEKPEAINFVLVPEVCSIFCATANAAEIILAATEQGRAILGVVDGASPKGVEGDDDMAWRRDLLRKIGYKL